VVEGIDQNSGLVTVGKFEVDPKTGERGHIHKDYPSDALKELNNGANVEKAKESKRKAEQDKADELRQKLGLKSVPLPEVETPVVAKEPSVVQQESATEMPSVASSETVENSSENAENDVDKLRSELRRYQDEIGKKVYDIATAYVQKNQLPPAKAMRLAELDALESYGLGFQKMTELRDQLSKLPDGLMYDQNDNEKIGGLSYDEMYFYDKTLRLVADQIQQVMYPGSKPLDLGTAASKQMYREIMKRMKNKDEISKFTAALDEQEKKLDAEKQALTGMARDKKSFELQNVRDAKKGLTKMLESLIEK
jgi:DNA repair exonuclease SbcCD ATPase subunit